MAVALALPRLGEGAQCVRVQLAGADQAIRAEWVGLGSLDLASGRDAWEGEFCTEPSRFLPLRLWQGSRLLWEGTVPLADTHSENVAFRMEARDGGRKVVRVATVAPLPVVGSAGPSAAVAWVWGAFVLAFLGILLRRRGF